MSSSWAIGALPTTVFLLLDFSSLELRFFLPLLLLQTTTLLDGTISGAERLSGRDREEKGEGIKGGFFSHMTLQTFDVSMRAHRALSKHNGSELAVQLKLGAKVGRGADFPILCQDILGNLPFLCQKCGFYYQIPLFLSSPLDHTYTPFALFFFLLASFSPEN